MNEHVNLSEDKNNFRIRNMLANIERTFLPVGSIIGKYRIIEEIDRGGMAVVYKATQLDLDRVVALKVMPANISINRGFVERFLTEAHAVAKLNHPNIVKIYEVATENNIYYLSMEYIPGKNLYYHLHYHKPKLIDVLEIIAHLADALSYAHGQKIIHRDLKLNNVIMRDHLNPVLIDFGLAKAMENDETTRPGITRTGEIMGSPSYMAPERLLGGLVDHRSDICSLGIMLYEMLTFKNPYLDQRNLHQTTLNVMESNPIPPRRLIPWLPIEIEAITLKAMAKEPENRYQSMLEFKADIMRYQRGDPVLAKPPSLIAKIRHFTKRHWAPLVISSIILMFSALFVITFYIQSKKEESHWQLLYNETFEGKENTSEWTLCGATKPCTDSSWIFKNGCLSGKSTGMIYALLNKSFNSDILIECDINGNPSDLYNAGIFLSGNDPDSGYCFYVNKDGLGNHGMTLDGSTFLFTDTWSSKVPLYKANHIVIERIQNSIIYTINGIVVTKFYDNLPLLGKGHDKLGIFIQNGSAQFDNFKIYRRAVPQVPSPTLIADRFWERGDFEAALDEYRGLLLDFANSDIEKEIKIKMTDCLYRLGKYNEARELIDNYDLSFKGHDDRLIPRKYFLKAVIFSKQGDLKAADSMFNKLTTFYPLSNVTTSVMNHQILKCIHNIRNGSIKNSLNDISSINTQFRRSNTKISLLYEELLNYYFRIHSLDTAISIASNIIDRSNKNESLLVSGRLKLAELYLDKGKKDDAKEIYDIVITGNAYSDRVWEALDGMAQINEYEFGYHDAISLYKKIYLEGPQSSPVAWMAGVSMASLVQKESSSVANKMFTEIDSSSRNPFPEPRLIAKYFLNKISDTTFETEWLLLHPKDSWYLYYKARKAFDSNNLTLSQKYLYELKDQLDKREWHYFRVIRVLNNFNRW